MSKLLVKAAPPKKKDASRQALSDVSRNTIRMK